MSILGISSQDNRLFNAEVAAKLGDINAAVIIQQLHYWMGKEGVGTIMSASSKFFKAMKQIFAANCTTFNTRSQFVNRINCRAFRA